MLKDFEVRLTWFFRMLVKKLAGDGPVFVRPRSVLTRAFLTIKSAPWNQRWWRHVVFSLWQKFVSGEYD